MKKLRYTLIKDEEQYKRYCDILESLVTQSNHTLTDEIELLTLLVEKWEAEHNTFQNLEPIELLHFLMKENALKAKDLVGILNLSKGTISKILNYQKGLSKETIRKLSTYFKISQEAFNRPYKLKSDIDKSFRPVGLGKTKNDLGNSLAI